ncbi:hypothetical protein F4777DRAFT_359382 [Nemania sp. FL0916]|nr:hypothetical protein F4777DRAFT_359382 [Nemania sp. FL0916]
MSFLSRAVARASMSRLVQKPTIHKQSISWMAFELPDPALYPPPATLQPKRPVGGNSSSNSTGSSDPLNMAAKVGSAPSTGRPASDVAASAAGGGKTVPASVPASAMRTGTTPLSQVQKRTISTDPSSPTVAISKGPSTTTVTVPHGSSTITLSVPVSSNITVSASYSTTQVAFSGGPSSSASGVLRISRPSTTAAPQLSDPLKKRLLHAPWTLIDQRWHV